MPGDSWTTKEIQFLRDNAMTMTCEEMASHLGRSMGSVYKKASSLVIRMGKRGVKSRISEEDKAMCQALRAEGMSYKVIAEKMEVSVGTAWRFCNEMAMPKSTSHDAWLSRELRKSGMKYEEIAEKMELSASTIWKMCNFKGKYRNDNAHQG